MEITSSEILLFFVVFFRVVCVFADDRVHFVAAYVTLCLCLFTVVEFLLS